MEWYEAQEPPQTAVNLLHAREHAKAQIAAAPEAGLGALIPP
jgi:hypothetical protein